MYLKSLVLKGFKSFADRSVLPFEPGLNAVVGPNGSGKSNISDAVLWVLGERNAKHLRGQAMEDVIFAGSTARKAVGVAEVDLVLDNTDGTLPVDFSEVVLTRRIYRTGESEYLINGTVSRRLDVLDILHDSGLGTGTHSIISQGSLDSILQSRPEDRRALVEEAAGVLKHKQRKAKSERKLASMDAHLDRVRDVVGEIERTLKPLERKAKKARSYAELSGQLAEATLALAVDDLRRLQKQWDVGQERERTLAEEQERRRCAVTAAEKAVEELQETARLQTADAHELARQHRSALAAVERFDGVALVLRERRRAAREAQEAQLLAQERNRGQLDAARRELAEAEAALSGLTAEREAADAAVCDLERRRDEGTEQRQTLERAMRDAERARGAAAARRERIRRDLAKTQERLAEGIAHAKLVESRGTELEERLEQTTADMTAAADALERAERSLAELVESEGKARSDVAEATRKRDAARRLVDDLQGGVTALEAEARGLEELERASSADSPARLWLLDNLASCDAACHVLSHHVQAPPELEPLVEALLSRDVLALVLADEEKVASAAALASARGEAGLVTLVSARAASSAPPCAADVALPEGAFWLVDRLQVDADAGDAVKALLGDVVVCPTLESCLAARSLGAGLRFATEAGCVAWPSGKVCVGAAADAGDDGVLARARKLQEVRAQADRRRRELEAAREALRQAEEGLRAAQGASLKLVEALAALRGTTEAARSDARAVEGRLAAVKQEYGQLEARRAEAQQAIDEARPTVESLEGDLEAAVVQAADAQRRFEESNAAIVPVRKELAQVRDALSDAKLKAATLGEREKYNERMAQTRRNDLERIAAADRRARRDVLEKRVVERRIAPIAALVEELSASARRWTLELEERATSAESSSASLYNAIDEARAKAKGAHDAFDETSNRLSEVRVEKGRLEIQVNATVEAIVEGCSTPLDHALELPELEDRASVQEEAASLERRLKAMGSISPDAVEEYEAVRQRYDYLAAQVADMQSARASLSKIVRVIDRRMKEDFERTYAQVNENFKEIFAELFPGGFAELSLVDPDDMDNTGIEVVAQPRGKRIAKMSLMSGGEKSLTALALLFAVYRCRTTPFYLLDEVEAALDDSNLRRLIAYLNKLRDATQLIMITHQRRTMESADVLFGVSMQNDGVTRVVSQRLDKALAYAK